jgi:hypothetical protein
MPEDHDELIGVWKLLSFDIEYKESGRREPFYGDAIPVGYIIFTPEARMMALIATSGRESGQTDAQQAALFRTMLALTGLYRVEPDRFIIAVDVSWNQALTGTEQVRFYELYGHRLDITTAWMPHPIYPERGSTRSRLIFERSK